MIKQRLLINITIAVSFSLGMWYLGHAVWIISKAYAASILIDEAWRTTLQNREINKPWSWADTWPIAEIAIPAIDLKEIVLSSDSGESLAFGPGLSNAGAGLDNAGVKLISAHRDTHFRKLKYIDINDEINIRTVGGSTRYKVKSIQIVDSRLYTVNAMDKSYDLLLATCYPFSDLHAGGHERFIVQAKQVGISQT